MTGRSPKQTTNNKHPKHTNGGTACFGIVPKANRPHQFGPSIVHGSNFKSSRFAGCRGGSPGLWGVASRSKRRGFASLSERSPHGRPKGQGFRSDSDESPWHPQAGAGQTHTKQHTPTTRVSGVGHLPVQGSGHLRTPADQHQVSMAANFTADFP